MLYHANKAKNNSEQDYYFIIDEINRGNLSKIFGELLMLIESDKRGEKIKLAYQKQEDDIDKSDNSSTEDEPFYVPSNLYIIGIMNTANRSLAKKNEMDYIKSCFTDLFDTDKEE
ncbi:MAG: AAA family ATPase [Ruminococcus sp.]|nr:AAA family ATPase [Ruminococcus sp.]